MIVIGGGLGGLLIGSEVKHNDGTPLVLEASGRPGRGGSERSGRTASSSNRPPARCCCPTPISTPIFEAARVPFVAAHREAGARFVYDRGTLFEVPEVPSSLLTRLVSWRAKLQGRPGAVGEGPAPGR